MSQGGARTAAYYGPGHARAVFFDSPPPARVGTPP